MATEQNIDFLGAADGVSVGLPNTLGGEDYFAVEFKYDPKLTQI